MNEPHEPQEQPGNPKQPQNPEALSTMEALAAAEGGLKAGLGNEIPHADGAAILKKLQDIKSGVLGRIEPVALSTYPQLVPNMREAHRKINDAERSEAVKSAESEKKVREVAKTLWNIFSKMGFVPDDDTQAAGVYQNLAKKLLSKTRLKANDLINEIGSTSGIGEFISRKRIAFNAFMRGQDPDLLELKRKLKVIPNVTKGFIKLRRDFYGFHTMEARQIWIDNQYAAAQNHKDLAEYAEESMAMVDPLFNSGVSASEGKFTLHPVVAAENDIDKLQDLAITEPVDEESFNIMQSAATKISLIHYTLYAKQVDQDVIKPASKALHQRLEDIIDTKNYPPDQVLNPPELPLDGVVPKLGADDKHVIIDRFEVDLEAKTNVSIIRKLIIKDIQNLGKSTI